MRAQTNAQLTGMSISPGLAMGRAFVYRDIMDQDLFTTQIQPDQVDGECERVRRAAVQVFEDLTKSVSRITQQIGAYQAEIFKVHQVILRELLHSREIRQEIERERVNAEVAVQHVFSCWVQKMQMDESARFIQRADDVEDLGRRLIRALKKIAVHPLEAMPENRVLIASQLLPSDAVFFAARGAVSIVVERGGAGSHCAILTRQIGIPAVSSVINATDTINTGDMTLVDGYRGSVVVDPDETTRQAFKRRIEEYHARGAIARSHCNKPAITVDGTHVSVMANVANRTDVEVARQNGADGVGLYRLEALFMLHDSLPTEEELFEEISDTLAPLEDKPAIVRLLDVGSDKNLSYLEFPIEPAPCLGRRGVRLLLSYPDLLKVQVRVLLRLSQLRPIQILVPFVTIAEDIQKTRQIVELQASELEIAKLPPLLAMIETPAAALSVQEILQFADALSLGTNDLAQYTMAAGRQNPLVSQYFREDAPAVFRLIRLALREAKQASVGICGELAGQPDAVPVLLDAGVRFLSVAPPLVPAIKEAVRHSRGSVISR